MSSPIITAIMDKVEKCKLCILKDCGKAYFKGSATPKIVVIGESPGSREVELEVPFVGPSGELLTDWLLSYGQFSLEDIYFTNRIKCFPAVSSYAWATHESHVLASCDNYLDQELVTLKPRYIITVGKYAMNYLIPGNKSILAKNGQITALDIGYGPISVLTLVHPAFILRQKDAIEKEKWSSICRGHVSNFLKYVR